MKKKIIVALALEVITLVGLPFVSNTYAEGEEKTEEATDGSTTSIGITPVSKVLQIASNSEYEDNFAISNDGPNKIKIEVYAAPYSYVYSESDDEYKLGFNNENHYTQIARWITFQNPDGSYTDKPIYTIEPNSSYDVHYKITTPSSIPAGGQYAVLFAHTLTATTSANGIRTEASPGLIVYGRSTEGETKIAATISNMTINQSATDGNGNTRNTFSGSAKVKNEGNVDFNAIGTLKVEGIFGSTYYETPSNEGRVSVIPESELAVFDEWEETPDFGIFKVTWTVKAGEATETIERTIFLISPAVIITIIILLTFLTIGIIIMVKRRKEHRSRYAV